MVGVLPTAFQNLQMHLKHDPYWPGVVWGQSTPGCVYETAQVRELRSEALAALESPDDPGSLPR